MHRPVRRVAQLLCRLAPAAAATLFLVAPSQAAESVCVYQSRSYSEGAFICVQRSLMQSCTNEGARMVWKVVADKDIGDRCTSPLPQSEYRRRPFRYSRIARQSAPAAQQGSAKCFVFNGKTYCE
jgi:hypothetical protein